MEHSTDKIKTIGTLITEKEIQYDLIRLLGEGTTSRVYLSLRTIHQAVVALKIFKPEFLSFGNEAKEIFVDELRALATLKHEHVVQMYDYGIEGKIYSKNSNLVDIWFIVLEYISERTMVDLVKEHSFLSEEIAKYFFA